MKRTGTAWIRRMVAPVAMLLALGCDGGSTTEPIPPGVAGRYWLVEVNGQALPAPIVEEPAQRIFVEDGVLDLNEAGEFRQGLGYRVVSGNASTRSPSLLEGTYSVSGSRFQLRSGSSGRTYVGTISGGVIEYTASGDQRTLMLTWRKESS